MPFPKVVFLDLEGTLLKKNHQLDDGRVAPSAWTVLAKMLGEDCFREEELTKDKWLRGDYEGYLDWMKATVEIHRKYGLSEKTFNTLVKNAALIPGTHEAVQYFKSMGAVTAIVTGGFKALSNKAQTSLKIDHAFAGCEYFFSRDTGLIDHYNLLPADEQGKVGFMRLIASEHGASPLECAFVGDGKNDVHLAKIVGFSVAFNAQEELKIIADRNIVQPAGKENWNAVIDTFKSQFHSNRN
ncbi:MAG: HAD family hydrolase [Candidatus Thiodiazotropha sp. (ex Ctena orbiculata)]|nr:HAD family hydrolase [Candidatus Thiodiazotropha taylori]